MSNPEININAPSLETPESPRTPNYSPKGRYDPDHEERIEEHNVIVPKKESQLPVVNDLD